MNKFIWELENSGVIADRQEYSNRIRNVFITEIQQNIRKLNDDLEEIKAKNRPEAIPPPEWEIYMQGLKQIIREELDASADFLKKLKNKLSNYEIYKQKFKCRVCGEQECVCYEFATGTGITDQIPVMGDGRWQPTSGNDAEELQRKAGNNSGMPTTIPEYQKAETLPKKSSRSK